MTRVDVSREADPEFVQAALIFSNQENAVITNLKKVFTSPKESKNIAEDDSAVHVGAGKAKAEAGTTSLVAIGSAESWERVNAVPFHSWGGWGDLFNCVVSLKDWSQFAKHVAESIVNTFSQLESRQRRIPMSDGRSRAPRRRGLIRDMLRGCIERSFRWLQTGCACLRRPSGAVYASSHRRPQKKRAARRLWSFLGTSAAAGGRYLQTSWIALHLLSILVLHAGPAHWSDDESRRRPAGALRIPICTFCVAGSCLCRCSG